MLTPRHKFLRVSVDHEASVEVVEVLEIGLVVEIQTESKGPSEVIELGGHVILLEHWVYFQAAKELKGEFVEDDE
jgi:hypothetical protein